MGGRGSSGFARGIASRRWSGGIALVAGLVVAGLVSGCGSTGGPSAGQGTPSPTVSARQAFGAGPSPRISEVGSLIFRTPSRNIACAISSELVRCDIARKNWSAPSKPADCDLDYGLGMYIENGKADFLCAGDSVLGAATTTLEYGQGLRSGTLMCDSESFALRCVDEKTEHGFTLAVEQYNLF